MGAFRRRWPGISYGRGEDWHYVGEAGEPAFENEWVNAAADSHLAFRIREAGIVDVQGYIENDNAPSDPSTPTIFVLPTGYRPATDTYNGSAVVLVGGGTTTGYTSIPLAVTSGGIVALDGADMTPQFGAGAYIQYLWIQGQFFLDPASAP